MTGRVDADADGRARAVREVAYGTAAVAALLAVGTAGYVGIEGWGRVDALYMTFITLSTIGFGEVHPLSDAGKAFTVALAFVGIGTFAAIAARVVQLAAVAATLRQQRAMDRRIGRMQGHHVVAGYGRIGERVAGDLAAAGRDVVVIDRADDRARALAAAGLPFVQGEAEDDATLRAAGVDRAAGLVLVLPSDAANVFVTLSAREIAGPDLFVVARTNEAGAQSKLRRAGADKVVSPLEIGADRIALAVLRPRVDRFMEYVLGVGALGLDLEEVVVGPGSVLDGRSLADVDFRQRFEAVVVGVLRDGPGGDEPTRGGPEAGEPVGWRFNPSPRLTLAAGDVLVVLARAGDLARLRTEGAAAGPAR